MEHGIRIPETPTPESLLTAWGAGALPRREFSRRAALLGLGVAAAGRVLEAGPAAAQTRATTSRTPRCRVPGG
jgi:hypothetical protein